MRNCFDLHVHTTYSDGDFTPLETVKLAREAGLHGIAITDHDECRGFAEVENADNGIKVIPGIELAAQQGAHVLGLCIDWRNEALLRHVENVAEVRRARAGRILEKLREAGYEVSMEDVELECMESVIGRPHIAAALVKGGHAESVKHAFAQYLSSSSPYFVPYKKISVAEAAQLIIGAGGKAVLAHPGLMRKEMLDEVLPKLTSMGFWGIEAYHPAHTDEQCAEFENYAKRNGLYVTTGSDFHGGAKPEIIIGQETRGRDYFVKSLISLGI